jgi:hypothetical protein
MVSMRNEILYLLRDRLQEILLSKLTSTEKRQPLTFFIASEGLFKDEVIDEARDMIKQIESESIRSSSMAISGLLIACFLLQTNRKVIEKLTLYIENTSKAFEYSPLNDVFNLFFLCKCTNYLSTNLQKAIINKISEVKNKPLIFANKSLIYSCYLELNNKEAQPSKLEEVAQNLLRFKPGEMKSISEGIRALWLYEKYISPQVNSFNDSLRSSMEQWNEELKKQIIPKIVNLLLPAIEKDKLNDSFDHSYISLSTFDLFLIYETLLINEGVFLVVTKQDLRNAFETRSKELYLRMIKWQNSFWGLLFIVFFGLSGYKIQMLSNIKFLISTVLGIMFSVLILFLRYKHQFSLLKGKEWPNDKFKGLATALFISVAIFQMGSLISRWRWASIFASASSGIIFLLQLFWPHVMQDIVKDFFFPIKLPLPFIEQQNKESDSKSGQQ